MNKASSAGSFDYPSDVLGLEQAETVALRDGRVLRLGSERWVIPTPTETATIDWTQLMINDGPHLNSIRRWVVFNLRHKSIIGTAKGFLYATALFNSPAFISAAENQIPIPYLAFSQALSSLDAKNRWRLHYARDYYIWCYRQQFPHFLSDVVRKLKSIVIGGNTKGEAVRSADPNQGPLDAMEVAAITTALRAARLEGTMPVDEQAALWLCLAFGANASQYAMMREEDIAPEILNGQVVTTLVSVPRHKKRYVLARTEFKVRKANRFVGRVLEDLLDANEQVCPKSSSNDTRPVFRRSVPRMEQPGLEEWRWHLEAAEFTKLVKRAVKRLRVQSRTGDPLRINTRRFRYSLATRMVEAGASKWALAAALDHSNLYSVGVYFDVDSGIVKHLDAAMAMVLAERAQRFATIVESEAGAVNGDRAGSRRYYGDREKNIHAPIGTCGHTSFCNINAPYACYLCPKFQAWMDGPHELVLDALIENRAKREEMGLDPKIISIEDELIASVADVISRIAALREEKETA